MRERVSARAPSLQRLVALVTNGVARNWDPHLRERTKAVLLDFLASLLAAGEVGAHAAFVRLARDAGSGSCASILLTPVSTSTLDAAAANAARGHIAEMDDVHLDVTGFHPGVTVLPAVLAVAEAEHSQWGAVQRAIAVGYEIGGRVGAAVSPSHRLRGFHATGTIGVLAASAAVAHLLNLDQFGIVSAIGLATSLSSGTFAVLEGGLDGKPLHAAHAAMMGVYSALLAREGLQGSSRALEAPDGFFAAFSDQADSDRMLQPPGEPWEIDRILVKPYACCAHAFGAVDLALELRDEIAPESVRRIEIATYHAAAVLDDVAPTTARDAKFSLPYLVGVALTSGTLPDDNAQVTLESTPARAIAERTTVLELEAANHAFPQERLTRLRITTDQGTVVERETRRPSGTPPEGLSYAAIRRKYERLANPRLGAKSAEITKHLDASETEVAWANRLAELLAESSPKEVMPT